MTGQVLEWAPYRLKQGIDEATLLQASERLQREFLARQEGFVRRELIKGAEGAYIDLIVWDSFEQSQEAVKHAVSSMAWRSYFMLMDRTNGDPRDHVLLYSIEGSYRPAARLLALAV